MYGIIMFLNSFDEVKKFTDISHEWWNKNGDFAVLHKINPLRLEYIFNCLKKHESKTVLDLGCGGGLLSIPLALKEYQVVGIDGGDKNIEIAKDNASKFALNNIEFISCMAEHIPEDHFGKYDAVVCCEMIEHVENLDKIIEIISKLLKKDGITIISTLNKTLKSKVLGIYAAEYILGWVPKNTHDFNKFVTPLELNNLANMHKMQMIDIKGIIYNIFTSDWELKDFDVDINYISVLKK